MSPRTWRWLVILLALGIPVVVIVTASRADRNARVDVAFPPRCLALFARVEVGPLSKVLDEARATATSNDATAEERACATRVVAALGGAGGATAATATSANAVTGPVDPAVLARLRTLPAQCQGPVGEALAGNVETARTQLERVVRSGPPEVLGCARGILSRLPPRPTFTDWTFEQANRVVRDVTGRVPGGPFALAGGARAQVTGIVWFLTAGMVLIALRQLLRWRRERIPGPVVIAPVTGSADDKDAQALAGIMRERLAAAGVYPNPTASGVGELAVDVADVLGAAGDTGVVGNLVSAVKAAVSVQVGYTLRATVDHGAAGGPVKILVQLDQVGTGTTLLIENYQGATEHDAATNAAFGTYLCLARLPEVRRRTPSFLQWTSADGLGAYEDAMDRIRQGSLLGAREKLMEASKLEPANLLVQLELSDVNVYIGHGTPADNALRTGSAGERYHDALLAALRAVKLNPHATEAHSQLALVLAYVEVWQPARGPDSKVFDEIARLVSAPLPPDDANRQATLAALDLADRHWRMARRRTWWPWIIWVAGRLNRRRTVAGQLWPLRRRRHAVHDLVLAAEVSTRYRYMRFSTPGWRRKAWTWIRLWEVRLGRLYWLRRPPSDEVTVQYNLAAAYARRAEYFETRAKDVVADHALAGRLSARAIAARRYAVDCLERSFTGVGRQLTAADLEGVLVEPDFTELRDQEAFRRWSSRFVRYNELEATRDAWQQAYRTLAERADATGRNWVERMGVPAAPPRWPRLWDTAASDWAASAVGALGDEVRRWETLARWARNPAATREREDFIAATADPRINQGRPVDSARDITLPGDAKSDAQAMSNANLVAFQSAGLVAEWNEEWAKQFLRDALEHLADRRVDGVERELRVAGEYFREAWKWLASYAARPSAD